MPIAEEVKGGQVARAPDAHRFSPDAFPPRPVVPFALEKSGVFMEQR